MLIHLFYCQHTLDSSTGHLNNTKQNIKGDALHLFKTSKVKSWSPHL